MNCDFCFAHKNEDEELFDINNLKLLKTKLPKESFSHVVITGGEPLLHFDLVKQIRAEFQDGQVNSNGALLTDEIVEWLIETKTRLSLSLDYDIVGFSGHDSENVRNKVQDFVLRYPELKGLLFLMKVIPAEALPKLSMLRHQQKPFEKDVPTQYNILDPVDMNFRIDLDLFFEKEMDRIESGKITLRESVFRSFVKRTKKGLTEGFNTSSCEDCMTLNHRGEIHICNEFAAMPKKYVDEKYGMFNVRDFEFNNIREKYKEHKHGINTLCKEDCFVKYFCGGMCWRKEKNDFQCELFRHAFPYTLYIEFNYISNKELVF